MKKHIIFIAIIFSLLTGCQSKKIPVEPSNNSESDNQVDIANYSGKWYASDDSQNEVEGGTSLKINIQPNGEISGTISTWSPNYNQLADADFSGQIKENAGDAELSDEAWGYSGTVTFSLLNDMIYADIMLSSDDSLFSINSGKIEFVRALDDKQYGDNNQNNTPDDVSISEEQKSIPTEEEVLGAREKVLEGMSKDEIDNLKENIKAANQTIENAYLYDNLFEELSDPENLYWNYIDKKGEIQIGWAYDGTLLDIKNICEDENLTENEFYEKYGEPVLVNNKFDADDFIALLEEMKETIHNDSLKRDMDNLIENMQNAKDTHDMEYINQVYKILHDMDYYLLRYGPIDVAKYVRDCSLIDAFYNTLTIYKE